MMPPTDATEGPWTKYQKATPQPAEAEGPWTKYQAQAATPEEPARSKTDILAQGAGNLLAGAVRGAGSIGATLMAPIDMAKDALDGKGVSLESNRQRRADMDSALQTMGAEPESWMYQGGKLAGEIAGTAGAGGVMANGVRAAGATKAMSGLEPITKAVAAGLETGGFRVGELAGTGLGAATRVATGAATGGVSAAMVNPEDAGIGAAIGGAVPAAVRGTAKTLHAARKAIGSVVGEVSPEVRQLATRAQELGIKIPADRLVDSKALNATAGSLEYVPLSGRAGTIDLMNTQLNRALSRTVGQDSPNVTGALRKAADDLGGKFDTVLQANTLKITPKFKEALAEAENQATNELGPDGASIIHKQIASILTKGAGGEIDGQAAYNIKKTLDRIGQRNTPEAFYASDLKKNLMDALNDSLGAEQAQSFKTLRQQYGNMLALQNLARNGVDGEISVARLANLKHINNPDLQELADIAAQFVKPREAAHGNAQRVFGAGGASTAAVLGAMGVPVAGAAAIAAGGVMGVGRVANKALNSQTARNAILKPAVRAGAQPAGMSALTKGVSRAVPLLGASTMAGAQPTEEAMGGDVPTDPAPDPQSTVPAVPQEAPPQPAFTSKARPDGTMAIAGDPVALRSLLQQAGIPAKSIATSREGLLIGRTQALRAQEVLDALGAAEQGNPAEEETAIESQPVSMQALETEQNQSLAPVDSAQAATETIANVQDPTQATGAGTETQTTPVETATAMASNAAPTQGVPGAGNPADLQPAGLTGEGGQFADAGAQTPLQAADTQPIASIDQTAHAAATSPMNDRPEPTPAQQRAGNYALGHDRIAGMDVSIENPQGSVRRGVDPDGKPWETEMRHHYGYLRRTSATDGDKLDVFIKPGTPKDYTGPVFVIDQVDPRTGKLDEHKTILGAVDENEAKEIYAANYAPGWKGMGSITRLPLPVFKAWAQSGSKKEPLGDLEAARAEQEQPAVDPQQQAMARIDRLREAGEDGVADLMQQDHERGQRKAAVPSELARMRDVAPDLAHHTLPEFTKAYEQLRSAGVKPAEAAGRAGLLAAVAMRAPEIGMPEKAVAALQAQLQALPLEAAPSFAQRFTEGLIKRGVMQPFAGAGEVSAMLEQGRDGAMHAAAEAIYSEAT